MVVPTPVAAGPTSDAGPLAPYVPRLLGAWAATDGDARHMRLTGSLAFVDISGFTRLTERLARRGRIGAEEMSDALDATFAGLLSVARADGADLVKWGGDAVLLLFQGDLHAARAARSAYLMRRTLREIGRIGTTSGTVTLRMSVGVHSGEFDFFLVGDPDIHRELVLSGPAASATAAMEAAASAGQIGVSAGTVALLPERLLGRPLAGGRLLRSAPSLPDVTVTPGETVSTPAAFLSPPIRAHLLAGTAEPEHRAVTVAFIQFSGTDDLLRREGPAALADALDHCVRSVQLACRDHGVTFLESDINLDGGKIMLAAGAPGSAGHDEDRMLRVARLLTDAAGRLPLRIGINRGHVFAGDFGPDFRRTYSIKGDAINLAARVMAKAAPGQVLATPAVVERSPTVFRTVDVPPFLVKGKSLPVHTRDVGDIVGMRGPVTGGVPFTGRDAELATLLSMLEAARGGAGRLVDLVGEPGIGKSRLVEELLGAAHDVVTVVGRCEEYESSTAYFPFRRPLRTILGLGEEDGADTTTARLTRYVTDVAPHLLDWLPLLAVPLDLHLPPTRATSELDEQFRKAQLEQAVCDLLARALPGPSVLAFEDVHLMDDASADLLQRLAGRVAELPWVVVVTRRDVPTGLVPRPGLATSTMRLATLEPTESMSLLHAALADHPLPPQTLEAIALRAGGNPMFLEALVAETTGGTGADLLPESVEELVTTQVDRLHPVDRTVLRYAAVLGTVVDEDLLVELLDGHAQRPADGALDRLSAFLTRERPGRLSFRHALMRDVAYEGLPFQRRRVLHEQVGRRIEARSATPDAQSELLSLHFFHAGRYDDAWRYSVVAGRRALAKYANGDGIDFLRRAVVAARDAGTVADEQLAGVLEQLGDALFRIGLAEDAAEAFTEARRHVRGDPLRLAVLAEKQAQVDQRLRRLSLSLRRITVSLRLLEGRDDRPARVARSRLARRYAFTRYWQGRTGEALRWAELAAHEAEQAVDKDALARAYEMLNAIHVGSRRPEPLPYGRLALQAYVELGNLPHQAHCLNNLGLQAFEADRWSEALDLYGQASRIFERVGDSANEGNVLYNHAEVLVRQRRYAEAAPLIARSLRIARSVSDRELVALVLREEARCASATGDHELAGRALRESRQLFEELGEADEVRASDLVLAELLLDDGRAGEAEAVLERLGVGPGDGGGSARTAGLRARLQLLRGQLDEARTTFHDALTLAERSGSRYERGLLLGHLAEVDRERGDDVSLLLEEAAATLGALGVREAVIRR